MIQIILIKYDVSEFVVSLITSTIDFVHKIIFVGICELLSCDISYTVQEYKLDCQNGLVENYDN